MPDPASNPALRNWQMLCPRRYDLQRVSDPQQQGGITLLGQSPGLTAFPQGHVFAQLFGVVSMSPEGDEDPTHAVHVNTGVGFFCTRCLSQASESGVVLRYTGDPDEIEAMRAMAQAAQAAQASAAVAE